MLLTICLSGMCLAGAELGGSPAKILEILGGWGDKVLDAEQGCEIKMRVSILGIKF